MFRFDSEVEGFISIIRQIETNNKSGKLTHKEVRAYARCLFQIIADKLNIPEAIKPETKVLLVALSCSSIAHYDRSFLASRILKLLEDEENRLREQVAEEGVFDD